MIQVHTYFIIRRQQANLSEANWVKVIDLVKAITGVNGHAQYKTHWRGNLDTFEVDNGDPEIPNPVYSNEYIFEARFPENAVSFEAFKNKLVSAFDVAPETVTYTIGTQTILTKPSAFATYRYGGTIRMYLGLFGWADEDTPPTWEESRQEAVEYIKQNVASWEVV